jgi:signal transduction protein with GAF and PtsI domain
MRRIKTIDWTAYRPANMVALMDELLDAGEQSVVDLLHDIGSRMASADALHTVLERVITLVLSEVKCDSCFVYVLENNELVLRASKNPHPAVVDRLRLRVGQGITGWTAEHHEPVALSRNAFEDPRFTFFSELPEDKYEAFLSVPVLCRGRVVGVINVQHRLPHSYTRHEIKLISTIGFLVGAEIEMARLEGQVFQLSEQLEVRKLIERAKGILQRDMALSEEEAYRTLQSQSRQMRKPMKEVAEAIVISDEVKRK